MRQYVKKKKNYLASFYGELWTYLTTICVQLAKLYFYT